MTFRTQAIKEAGQSIWLDNIQRRELYDGTVQQMIQEDGVSGITSNPTIFMNSVTKSRDYDEQILELTESGKDAEKIYRGITLDDIKKAGTIFLPIFKETDGRDGFVSIELNPQNAFNAEESIKEAREILSETGLPNIMIKVPGTREGIKVARQLISEGMNVNITLLFSPEYYRQVALAYIEGLEERDRNGKEISNVHSVASFFISRIDTKVDKQIDAVVMADTAAGERAAALRGQTAINVAKVTYAIYKELFFSQRFKNLQKRSARIQRPLWASTGTKDPAYSDVKYVEGLIAPGTINTLPPQTIAAFRDHGVVEKTMEEGLHDAPEVLKQIEQCGIDLNKIFDQLLDEGVRAFEKSYLDLLKSIKQKGVFLASHAEG